jgi:hypothetical protein
MNGRVLVLALVALAAPALAPAPARPQELTADVRTRTGQTLRLAQPTFEVSFTSEPSPQQATRPEPGTTPAPMPGGASGGGRSDSLIIFGSARNFDQAYRQQAPPTVQGSRVQATLALGQGPAEVRVPVERLATLELRRQPVAESPLPPYAARRHARHAAVAVLTDGARIDADYVNLGTAVLCGTTLAGPVAIPWDEIELVRFRR